MADEIDIDTQNLIRLTVCKLYFLKQIERQGNLYWILTPLKPEIKETQSVTENTKVILKTPIKFLAKVHEFIQPNIGDATVFLPSAERIRDKHGHVIDNLFWACLENKTIAIDDDVLSYIPLAARPTFLFCFTKNGVITSSHPVIRDFGYNEQVKYSIAKTYNLWYKDVRFIYTSLTKLQIDFLRLIVTQTGLPLLPICNPRIVAGVEFDRKWQLKGAPFFQGQLQINGCYVDILSDMNMECPNGYFVNLDCYQIYEKYYPEYYNWIANEGNRNISSYAKIIEEYERNWEPKNSRGDGDDWMDDPENYWNID